MHPLACLLLLAEAAPAASVPAPLGLFEAEIAIADREPASRPAAIAAGLAQVVFRLVGQEAALRHPLLRAALARPEGLLERFAYQEEPGPDGRPAGLALRAAFRSAELLRLLDDAELPLWLGPRPTVLLLVERPDAPEEGGRFLAAEDAEAASWRRAARALAFRVELPLLDPVERHELATAPLEARTLAALGRRYGLGVVLAGRIVDRGEIGEGEWVFWQPDRGASRALLAPLGEQPARAFEALHGWLAERYALPPSERVPDRFPLAVAGLRGAADYLTLMAWLRAHGLIEGATPEQAEGDRLELAVEARARRFRVVESLLLEPRLARDPRPRPGLPPELQLLWLP
ncbi:MAG: DUF2066 domain-containing protein [Xanthomonadales bacterium]|nr:DUF2066 domain-containing protein [Xanthomonadales bacterium]